MQSLGVVVVTTKGTPVKLSSTSIVCSKIWIQPMQAGGASGTQPTVNTGYIYFLNSSTAKATGLANCIFAVPSSADSAQPFESLARNGWDLSKIWMDSDNNSDGALISYE